jgi:hypothetical protein
MPSGTHKNIKSPEMLWGLFCDYKKKTKESPILKHVFVGKDGDSREEKREKPLTLEGFENYVADLDIIQDLGDYFSNNGGAYKDFILVCKSIIFQESTGFD